MTDPKILPEIEIFRAVAPKSPALANSRVPIAAALVAAILYALVGHRLTPGLHVALKGSVVGILAIAAARLAIRREITGGWRLAAILAAGALGDMLLDVPGLFLLGGGSFAVGHLFAIAFYRRYRRAAGLSLWLGVAALVAWGAALPWLMIGGGAPGFAGVALYALLVSGMAATALLSGFPKCWTGLGAIAFLASDSLLIMRLGGHLAGGAAVHDVLVWSSYSLGQVGIFIGVAIGPARD